MTAGTTAGPKSEGADVRGDLTAPSSGSARAATAAPGPNRWPRRGRLEPRRRARSEAPQVQMPAPLSVLMVTSEAHPFAKTGGLAEVSASLSRRARRSWATRSRSCCLAIERLPSMAPSASRPGCASAIACSRSAFYERRLSDQVTVVLVDVPELFDREGIYGTADGRLSGQRRCASPCSAAPPSSIHGCASSGRRSSTPTTGRRGSCRSIRRCTCRPTRSSAACLPFSRCTTSRFRACFPPRLCPRSGSASKSSTCRGSSSGATSAT